jgi:hypothetical protein
MSEKNERLEILAMIESGVINASEAARLLKALEDDETLEEEFSDPESGGPAFVDDNIPSDEGFQSEDVTHNPQGSFEPEIEKWRRWWMIPLWVGVGITIVSALLLFWAYQASGFSFWFGCAWVPFFLGLGVIALAWGSRTARWLHLRIEQEPGEWPQTIAFSFPLPLRFTSWVLRTFGHFIPDLRDRGVDVASVVKAIETTTGPDAPFYVEVDEGEGKEKVQIYIG